MAREAKEILKKWVNGVASDGKNTYHIITPLQCDVCHRLIGYGYDFDENGNYHFCTDCYQKAQWGKL